MDNNIILYAVQRTDYCDDYTTIMCIDGGIAEIHHNGDHYVTTYFQDRIEGEVDEELEWLHPQAIDFREVDFLFLNNQISRQ